jgi:hypothetical protein
VHHRSSSLARAGVSGWQVTAIRKTTSPTASALEKKKLIALLCESGLQDLKGSDRPGRKDYAWLANHGLSLRSTEMGL